MANAEVLAKREKFVLAVNASFPAPAVKPSVVPHASTRRSISTTVEVAVRNVRAAKPAFQALVSVPRGKPIALAFVYLS